MAEPHFYFGCVGGGGGGSDGGGGAVPFQVSATGRRSIVEPATARTVCVMDMGGWTCDPLSWCSGVTDAEMRHDGSYLSLLWSFCFVLGL